MTKSALNAIGGNVVYIPYSPVFINNQMVTGYSNFPGQAHPGHRPLRRHHRV
jgi:hypothetical protein